ncbi:carboxypeptidase B-like [Lingula anatina]|uniref:Carboxypeptidase B-like n=1 Tax=Lingula anatina TaxID=7574 RepID=A0A1S3I1X9_LINAN|nr:carboxypeptidase B-like [Lingula anatina]|eukprot:XP_013391836.1 carboxypeptidase B-like [Lingula anatina]
MRVGTLVLLCALVAVAWSKPVWKEKNRGYKNYRLVRLSPTTQDQIDFLKRLENTVQLGIDFWTPSDHPGTHNIDIAVPPKTYRTFIRLIEVNKITYKVIQEDIQSLIDTETTSNSKAREDKIKSKACESQGNWKGKDKNKCKNGQVAVATFSNLATDSIVGTYARHGEINAWLDAVAAESNGLATVETIGQTYEGKDMKVLKIGEDGTKPAIWVDAGIHAREWIAPATLVYIIDKFLSEYNSRPELNKYTWYMLPVANPDGYEYSHTSDRLWRKTRSPQSRRCTGVDPNRNWDSHFGEAGTSSNPCSNVYPGTAPFSEKCTQNIRDFINDHKDRLKMYLSFHSYSELWLTPWGWGREKPSDNDEMMRVANLGKTAVQGVNGKSWIVGAPPDILYAASGGSYDWAKEKAGIKYAYTFELRPDGNASNGFVIPASEILPSGKEVYAAVKKVASELI